MSTDCSEPEIGDELVQCLLMTQAVRKRRRIARNVILADSSNFHVNEINYLAGYNFQEPSRFTRKTELHDVFTQAGPEGDIGGSALRPCMPLAIPCSLVLRSGVAYRPFPRLSLIY